MPRPRPSCRTVGWSPSPWDPRARESISAPSPFGGTYYLDLNGASDVEGDYRLTVQTVPDPTPPTVSMVLAGGRAATNQLAVPVTLSAADDLSGVTDMAFSADGATWTGWVAVPALDHVDLRAGRRPPDPVGEGPERRGTGVCADHGDGDDRHGPALVGDADPGARLDAWSGLRPPFTVTFDEPMDPASWSDLGLIVQAADGALVPGDYTYDDARRTGTFVPSVRPASRGHVHRDDRQRHGSRGQPAGAARLVDGHPRWRRRPSGCGRFRRSITFGGSSRIDAGPGRRASARERHRREPGRLLDHLDPAGAPGGRRRAGDAERRARSEHRLPVHVRGRRRHRARAGRGRRSRSGGRWRSSGRAARAWGGPGWDEPVRITAALGPAAPSTSVSFRLYRYDTVRRRVGLCRQQGTELGRRRTRHPHVDADIARRLVLARVGRRDGRPPGERQRRLPLVRDSLSGRITDRRSGPSMVTSGGAQSR